MDRTYNVRFRHESGPPSLAHIRSQKGQQLTFGKQLLRVQLQVTSFRIAVPSITSIESKPSAKLRRTDANRLRASIGFPEFFQSCKHLLSRLVRTVSCSHRFPALGRKRFGDLLDRFDEAFDSGSLRSVP